MRTKFGLMAASIIACLVLASCGNTPGNPEASPSPSPSPGSGATYSGHVTVTITGAAAANGHHFYAGTSYNGHSYGNVATVSGGTASLVIYDSSAPLLLPAGTYPIGAVLDMNDNYTSTFYLPDMNDMTGSAMVDVNGDKVVTIDYGSLVVNPCSSNPISVTITGVPAGESGKSWYVRTNFGASYVSDVGSRLSLSTGSNTNDGVYGLNPFPGGSGNSVPLLIMINENGGDPLSFPQNPATGDKYYECVLGPLNTLASFNVSVPYSALLTK